MYLSLRRLQLILSFQALLYANDDDRYDYIPKATVGLVFLGTPFRGTQWKTLLDSMAQLNGLAGSHRGITKELDFDEPVLLDKLHRFCRLRNRLSTPVSCFSELYETDYGRRVGLSGVIKGMVRNIHLYYCLELYTNVLRL